VKRRTVNSVAALLILCGFIWNLVGISAQDIVSSDDISGGSSVFVFRKSSKVPQTKASSRAQPLKRSLAQRTETRKKVREQISTVAKIQPTRKRTPKVDPALVAAALSTGANRNPRAPGVKSPQEKKPAPEASKEQASIALAGAAEVYLDRKEIDKAIEYFKESIRLNPQNSAATMGLSEAYVRKGDDALENISPESSTFFYDEAIKLDAKNSAAYAGLGQAKDALQQDDQALTNYLKALELNASLSELLGPVGTIYFQKGEIALAESYLMKAVAARPEDPDTQFYLGLVRFKQNRNEEAISAFRNAIAQNPNSAENHYYLGEVFDRIDRENEAIAEYKEAVRINPKYVDAWFDLGVANYNRGRYDEAIAAYTETLRLKNDHAEAHANLADVYRQLATATKEPAKRNELFGKANGEYSIAAVFIKNDPDLLSAWGYCLGRVGRWASTIDVLNKAVVLSPDASDYTNLGWAYYNSAQKDLRENKTADANSKLLLAKSTLEKAVSVNDRFEAAFLNLGITYTDLGDYNAAVNALKTATGLRKNWVIGINELGIAYRRLSNFDDAVSQFKRATDIDEKFAPGFYNLAEAEFRRGNVKEARKAQDKLRKLNPNLANQLEVILSGAVLSQPKQQVENKVNENNPTKKLPKPKRPF